MPSISVDKMLNKTVLVLTRQFVDEMLTGGHYNESCGAVLYCGAVYHQLIYTKQYLFLSRVTSFIVPCKVALGYM